MATLIDRLWDSHVVRRAAGEPDLLSVDFHLLHEGSSPQAFEGLRRAGRAVRRPDLTLATEDHLVSTRDPSYPPADPTAATMLAALRAGCREFGVPLLRLGGPEQGIVHVVGPQLGITQPGTTIVCGDSHTSTHGAFGALAFGIGTSQIEHVLATQTVRMTRPRTMAVTFVGALPEGVAAKDLALAVTSALGSGGAQGHVIEFRGEAVRSLSMEGRMTVCNMSIEAGARAGVVAPDRTTFEYLRGRPYAPVGPDWDTAVAGWSELAAGTDDAFDAEFVIPVADLAPSVTWGTTPAQVVPISGRVPDPDDAPDESARAAASAALAYMGLAAGTRMKDVAVDTVFLGSCTNGRLEDLRAAAAVLDGRPVAGGVRMIVVPGSMRVKAEAEAEGLDRIFRRAGAEWRSAGCSLCVGMNDDVLPEGSRCASTSNRNFEGRQGAGVRTHLVAPAVAAASAVLGRLAEPSDLEGHRR